ncbi:MAG: hypothetical protein AAF413_01415, partial [Patescibacteria group bacterium]
NHSDTSPCDSNYSLIEELLHNTFLMQPLPGVEWGRVTGADGLRAALRPAHIIVKNQLRPIHGANIWRHFVL